MDLLKNKNMTEIKKTSQIYLKDLYDLVNEELVKMGEVSIKIENSKYPLIRKIQKTFKDNIIRYISSDAETYYLIGSNIIQLFNTGADMSIKIIANDGVADFILKKIETYKNLIEYLESLDFVKKYKYDNLFNGK